MILNVKLFTKSMILNEKPPSCHTLNQLFYNTSAFESKILQRVRFKVNFLNTRQTLN